MVSVLLNSGNSKELRYLEDYTKFLSARISEDEWGYSVFLSMKEVLAYLEDNPIIDIACVDLTLKGGLDGAKHIRSLSGNTFMLVIADTNVSPMTYISPDVMATSLLLRPFDGAQLKDVVGKTVKTYIKKFRENDVKEDVFVVDGRDGKQLVPYDRIFCFEAREKKVFVVTDSSEYSFYDTLENLEKELPKQFVRSHRGFIVNVDRIVKIQLSQNIIMMEDDMEVPLSRSYKSRFKDII